MNISTDYNFNQDYLIYFWNEYGKSLTSILTSFFGPIFSVFQISMSIFSKGIAVFNYFFSVLLYITALFYLLITHIDEYQPVTWFTSIIFPFSDKLKKSIPKAVNSVFIATFKIAVFHALLSWITFKMFGCSLVYLSTIFSACVAIVPVFPTYSTCLFGVIELWLIKDQFTLAIILFVIHLLASWYIDPMIYARIESSHHYVTGLSIVGGLYFFGIVGVLYGPLLVCTILIFQDLTTQNNIISDNLRLDGLFYTFNRVKNVVSQPILRQNK